MMVSRSTWKMMDRAPRSSEGGKPAHVVLFLPGHFHQNDENGRPIGDIEHGECVGHWDAKIGAWVHSESGDRVYPSLWKPVDA